MASTRLQNAANLENLPLDILLIILAYLPTARTISNLGATSKTLSEVIRVNGWRVFVRTRFPTLTLPQGFVDGDWRDWARDLTGQSRSWERRAFAVSSHVLAPKRPARGPGFNGGGARFRTQTVPCHIIVDAKTTVRGKRQEDLVAWGAGEDVVVRSRPVGRSNSRQQEHWLMLEGASAGFKSGKDDVTAIRILDRYPSDGADILIGRASGDLRLLSMEQRHWGQRSISFQSSTNTASATETEQREIQSLDISSSGGTLAVATKDNVLFYPLSDISNESEGNRKIEPTESLSIREGPESKPFRFLRSIKFMPNGDLALGMTSSMEPLRYLSRTPTGLKPLTAVKMRPSSRAAESYLTTNNHDLETVRDILPINANSVVGGRGDVVLSSYDDGTVRLQDLRTPSPVDTIYQDHFEVVTPVGPLLSYGAERFLAGSARAPILKVFDFRWTATAQRYHYTDALPCGGDTLAPMPKPPTTVNPPTYPALGRCDFMAGRICRRHATARTDFYRPNCNVYLPLIQQHTSPIYSLAKSSDLSPIVYAGLAGELVDISLRDEGESGVPMRMKQNRAGYSYHESLVNMIETGDGIALSDISKSQRVPEIRKQTRRVRDSWEDEMGRMYRLDDLFV